MQDSWRHEALEGTGFLKVVFLFNTYHIFCAGTRGKTFLEVPIYSGQIYLCVVLYRSLI